MNLLSSSRLRVLVPAGALAALTVFGEPLQGQRGRATLDVAVTVAATGEPIGGAQVTVAGTRAFGITSDSGTVRLAAVPAGERTLEVRMLGLQPRTVRLTLGEGELRTVPVRMELAPVELQAVRVEASLRTRGTRMLTSAGFFDRRTGGHGTFLTRADLERMQPRFLSDVLRRTTSMKVSSNLFNRSRVGSQRTGRPPVGQCQVMFFLNGVPVHNFEPDDVPPQDVEGLEIYDGAAEVPSAYARGTAACGAILIWTRVN